MRCATSLWARPPSIAKARSRRSNSVTVSRRALRVVMASLMVAGITTPATAASEACFDFHGAVYLRNFAGGPPVNDVPSTFYSGVEGQSAGRDGVSDAGLR